MERPTDPTHPGGEHRHEEAKEGHAEKAPASQQPQPSQAQAAAPDARPVERQAGRPGARGTAAMDPKTRQEVARKGGIAVSRNRQHMAEIGRKGGQAVSKNREHMAAIGRKGGEASRGRG